MKTFITTIAITIILVFASCKKDANIYLPQIDLKKAIVGSWEWRGLQIVRHRSENIDTYDGSTIYNFLSNDTCMSNMKDTAAFKINYNRQINFIGSKFIDQGLYDVQITTDKKDTTMLWSQVPPFSDNNIISIAIYFKKH